MNRAIARLGAVAAIVLTCDVLSAQNLGTYGTPGLIDMPTAEVLPDGHLGFTASGFGPNLRNTMVFQMLPNVYGTFRYSLIDGFLGGGNTLYDRSFDVHFQLRRELGNWPAIALGLRDVGGTGVYAGEYLVATKTFANRFKVTGGIGWGRLATNGGIQSPLCFNQNRFCTRDLKNEGIEDTGQLDFGNWFRGDIAPFGGVEWQVNEKLSLLAEYSSDAYTQESQKKLIDINIPLNFGATYKISDATSISGYFAYGTEVGLQISYVIDPANPVNNAGLEKAPPNLIPVDQVALASWNLPDQNQDQPAVQQVLKQKMKDAGLILEGLEVDGSTAIVRLENFRYGASAQAIGRANRALANTMPKSIDTFAVVLLRQGLPVIRVDTKRSDLSELEDDIDGSWRSLARADLSDPYQNASQPLDGIYPRIDYRLSPYTAFAFFDPDNPLRGDVGIQFKADLMLRPGLTFSGRLRQPLAGNIDQATRQSNSKLPHVRSDWVLYAQQSDLELNHLTAEYIWQPRKDVFARVTGGYLEPMYGGISGEILWYPVGSRLALGGEMNWTRQRDFDMLLDFRDYNVTTGHASIYYDVGSEYRAQVDVGRYLAGDWGATFTLDREFNNGFKVGGFFTLTDVPFEEFGEGSFDKGITLEIPLTWFTGKPSKQVVGQVIRPVYRDGGARLNVRNRLYQHTRKQRGTRLASQWGRYYK